MSCVFFFVAVVYGEGVSENENVYVILINGGADFVGTNVYLILDFRIKTKVNQKCVCVYRMYVPNKYADMHDTLFVSLIDARML